MSGHHKIRQPPGTLTHTNKNSGMVDSSQMVVSPSGKLYFVKIGSYHNRLIWTYKDTESHSFWKSDDVKDYLNIMENGNGGLELRRYRLGRTDAEEFNWNSDDEFRNLLREKFGENIFAWSAAKPIYIEPYIIEPSITSKEPYSIRKKEYNIVGVGWRLRYVTYIITDKPNDWSSPLPVHQYLNLDSLEKKLLDFHLKEEMVASDIWINGITKELINVGSNISGSVYEGSIFCWPVAVKQYPDYYIFPEVVRKLWNLGAVGKIPYILHPVVAQVVPGGYDIAFQRCSQLHGLLQPSMGSIEQAISTLIDGLIALHASGITHGSINPWTVLIFDGKAKISGFNSCRFSTDQYHQEEDIIDVGRLIVYIYQKTTPADKSEAMYREITYTDKYIKKYRDEAARNGMHGWAGAARKLADLLIEKRIPLRRAGEHTFFWTYEKRVNFIFEVAGYLEDLKKNKYSSYERLMKSMRSEKSRYYDGEKWGWKIPKRVYKSSTSRYDWMEPVDLLYFMRNTLAHYSEISRKVKNPNFEGPIGRDDEAFIGTNSVGLEKSFQNKYPKYLATLYQNIRDTQNHQVLKTGLLGRFYDSI